MPGIGGSGHLYSSTVTPVCRVTDARCCDLPPRPPEISGRTKEEEMGKREQNEGGPVCIRGWEELLRYRKAFRRQLNISKDTEITWARILRAQGLKAKCH